MVYYSIVQLVTTLRPVTEVLSVSILAQHISLFPTLFD